MRQSKIGKGVLPQDLLEIHSKGNVIVEEVQKIITFFLLISYDTASDYAHRSSQQL